MAKIEFIGHRLESEPWHELYAAAAEVIEPDAWMFPIERLRHELLTPHEFHEMPPISGQQIHELKRAFVQARLEQAQPSGHIPTTKVRIIGRKILLGLTEDQYLDEARATADEILRDVIGYKVPLKARYENIRLGNMKTTKPDVYEHVKAILNETVRPTMVELGPLTGRTFLPSTNIKVDI